MRIAQYVWLFVLGLATAVLTAVFQLAPGYMDADYYYAGGLQLAEGRGSNEPFLWNYLADPAGLPHPSHAYWMPLASWLAALGMMTTGMHHFSTARLFFVLLAGCLPPLTAGLADSLHPKRETAWLAGLLAAFPGFYLPFLTTTDTFGMYAVSGGIFFIVLRSIYSVHPVAASLPFLLGLFAGLMHLARADGVLWLFIALLTVARPSFRHLPFAIRHPPSAIRHRPSAIRLPLFAIRSSVAHPLACSPSAIGNLKSKIQNLKSISLCLGGYLLVMAPWLLRNLFAFGTPFSPGGERALWLTNYDEMFIYPAALLTPARWWAAGMGEILRARLWALGLNLQTAFAVQGEIFLAPLIWAGAWRLRRDGRVRLGALAWLLTFLVMTLVFPFAGARGGLFHSGAAVQPLFWALAAVGLEAFVEWGGRRRGWQMEQARRVFAAGLVGLAILLTLATAYPKLADWGRSEAVYRRLEVELQRLGTAPEDVVMVNNPPGYFAATGRMAIPVPGDDLAMALTAAHRYRARFLLLEENHPAGLDGLYDAPGDSSGLRYVRTFEGTRIFEMIGFTQ